MGWGRRVVVVREPSPQTLDLLLDEARRAEDAQHRLHGSLDQRAGVLVGFAGVLVTMLVTADATLPTWARLAAVVAAGLAALAGAVPLGSRPLNTVSPSELAEKYGEEPRGDVAQVVADNTAWLVDLSAAHLARKSRWVRAAAVLLVVSVATVVLGVIVDDVGTLVDAADGRTVSTWVAEGSQA